MRKIILVSLFFCLTITTVLAQVATINIATPNSNGLSNNQVDDFDVNTDGTILNNSATGGTAQLGSTAVTGNSNITTGSEASLILFQVTGSSGSDLDGAIEVFGAEAGIIIANPNGIDCDGCGFINTNRVDLVTGSSYDVSTNTFGSIAATNITVGSGGLEASSVEVLNIQTGGDFYNRDNATINADNFNVTAGDYFSNYDNATINADNFNVTAGYSFYNSSSSTISADSFNVTADRDFYNSSSSTISADSFNVTADRDFYNRDNSTINANDFNVSADSFRNYGFIIAVDVRYFRGLFIENMNNLPIVPDGASSTDVIQSSSGIDIINIAQPDSNGLSNNSYGDFNISSSGLVFNNSASAVSSILADTIAGNPNYSASDSASLILNQITSNNASYLGGILEVAGDSAAIIIANPNGIVCDGCSFANTDKVDLITGTANLDAAGMISDYTTTDSSDYATTVNEVFIYNATIILREFNVTAGDNFFNWGNSTISTDNFNVTLTGTYGYFSNQDNATINADNFNFTVEDNFYNEDNATINANNFNVTAGGFFSNREDANINADNFNVTVTSTSIFSGFYNYNNATINTDNFNVTLTGTYGYFSNQDNATINADNFNFTVEDNFYNEDNATINANNFNVTAGDVFYNRDNATISADSFNVTGNYFSNADNATINADNLNFTIEYNFVNTATINADNFNVIADDFYNGFIGTNGIRYGGNISADSFNVTTGTYFINEYTSMINADNFNVITGAYFVNYGSTINADDFNVAAANGFFSNREDANINADNFNVTAANGFSNYNSATINADNFNVLTAEIFRNSDNATISADTVTIEVTNFADDIDNSATISSDSLNIILTDNFTHTSDYFSGFTFNNLDIITDGSFYNEVDLTVNNLNVTARNDFDNYATIDAENFIAVVDTFNNRSYATITAGSFNVTANSFSNEANATISANECNIIYTTSYTDNGTITCDDEIEVIDIARPDVNGLSNNSYTDFGISINGIVLNNSDSAGISELAGSILANTNYNNGDAASLILAQITGNDISLLEGALEVFGNEAGVIIANPNGITCDGCGFINTSRVDLVTGTANFSGDDLTDFSIDVSSTLTVSGSGFLSDAVANELKLEAQNIIINAQVKANNSLDIIANNYTQSGAIDVIGDISIQVTSEASLDDNASIQSSNLFFSAYDLYNQADFTITDNATFDIRREFYNGFYLNGTQYDGGDISADNFNVTTGNFFVNQYGATINANNLNFTEEGNFANKYFATISVDNFNVSARSYFLNDRATISADSFNVTLTGYYSEFYNQDATIDAYIFNVTANNFSNYTTINAGSFNVTAGNNFINRWSATINADSFNVLAGNGFYNGDDFFNEFSSTINADSFNVTAGRDFFNYDSATINADSFNVTLTGYNSDFYNQDNATINAGIVLIITASNFNNLGSVNADSVLAITLNNATGSFTNTGSASADTFALSVAGDFDYISDFLNNGTITANTLNLNVGGGFSNNDASNDFVWNAQNSLTVLGNADITADSYTQNGAIDVAGVLTINVESDFDYVADFDGTIDFNSINLNVGGDFSNNDSANDFTWGANDALTVLGSADITTNNFANDGNISADTFALSVAGDFDYIVDYLNNGNIQANTLNLTVGGDFSNNDSANDFTWGANDSLTVLGNADITADSYTQNGAIDVAGALTINVESDFDYVADFDGTIDFNSLSLNVGGDFSNNDTANDFTWGANDSLTVLGSADITADSYTQNGAIDVAGALAINVESDFDYVADFNGTIDFNSLNLNVGGDFSNNDTANDFTWGANDSLTVLGNADITADSYTQNGAIDVTGVLTINVASDFDYVADFNGTIDFNSLNLNVGGDFSNNDTVNDFTWGANDSLTVLGSASVVAANFENSGFITVNSFDITATDFTNSGTISANTTLNTTVSSTVSGSFDNTGGVLNSDTFALSVADDFDYIVDYLNNGTITTNTLNLNVGGDFSNNDASNDFVWNAQNSLTVLGIASVTAASFENSGIITVTNNGFDITATDFTNSGTISANTTLNTTVSSTLSGSFNNTGGVVSADTVSLSVAGDFDDTKKGIINANYFNLTAGGDFSNNDASDDFVLGENDNLSILGDFTIATNNYIQFGTIVVDGALNIDADRNFVNHGGITTESLNITTGYTAINQGSIVSDSLAITANDFFRNLTGGDVDVATLNITAGGKVTNTANITVGTLNIIANNDSSRTNDTTAFYVSNRGNITATTLNIAAVDNFYNRGNITATNFNITRAKAIFFLNKEIDSFYAAGHTYDGGDISLNGDASFTADGGIIENYGNIDLGDFNLDITANRFINQAGANVTANTLNLDVNSLIQHGFINAAINHQ